MKIYKLYESFVREAEIEACVAKFGNELFGSQLGGSEKNTDLENDYLEKIKDFTDVSYGYDIDKSFVKALFDLKNCTNQYPEILIPEKTNVYRGTTIPVKYFIDNKQQISVENQNNYVYKANTLVQSWSTNFESASIFGSHDILNEISRNFDFDTLQTPEGRREFLQDMINEDLRIAFVLQYKTNTDEFIFKSKYFKKLSQAEYEEELIRIDNKPINVIAWFNDNDDVFLSGQSSLLIKYINKAISEL